MPKQNLIQQKSNKIPKVSSLHQKLQKLYFNPRDPGSLGGAERLYQQAKKLNITGLTREEVKKFLASQSAYTLHKQARRHFPRNLTHVQGIDDQWQADLVDMQPFSRHNSGVKYLLTVIDVFSKYAWVIPLHRKSAEDLVGAFKTLFTQSTPRKPNRLQTDKGKEFLNSKVKALLKDSYGVHHFTSCSDQKAAVVERFNRTLKGRMWRYFSHHQTNHYLDILPQLLHSYNHSVHRSIGRAPATVLPKHEQEIARLLYGEHVAEEEEEGEKDEQGSARSRRRRRRAAAAPPPLRKSATTIPLKIGDIVRVSRVKGVFEKGYEANWSEEHFKICEIRSDPAEKIVYKLEDEGGEPIQGQWYKEELLPIKNNRYIIEKIIRKRRYSDRGHSTAVENNDPEEVLVKWRGWPANFNSWIPESKIPFYRAGAGTAAAAAE